MKLRPVADEKGERQFIAVPKVIHRDDPHFIPIPDDDIRHLFDPRKNAVFKHGEAERWILIGEDGRLLGRIAAFINYKKNEAREIPAGGIGFFECIDDQEAANMLFDKARDWLAEKGMKGMEGPINFGENNEYWGLMVEGFYEPSYGMNYHPPYYQKLFENYGFEPSYYQYTNQLDLTKPLPDRFRKIAQWVARKQAFTFKRFERKHADKFITDFLEVYNKAWSDHDNFTTIKRSYVEESFKRLDPILDEDLVWFVYKDDEPAGFMLAIPDVNQILRYFNGKLNLWNKLRFAWKIRFEKIERVKVVVMGIVPEYQEKGLEAGIIENAVDRVKHKSYRKVELSWVGDFNPKMLSLHKATGAKLARKHVTYWLGWDE